MSDALFDLSGKTALVPGASRGIGAATATLLARHGAHVIVSSRKQDGCDVVVENIRAGGGKATAIAAHIGDTASVDELFGRIGEHGPGVDILVNKAAANP